MMMIIIGVVSIILVAGICFLNKGNTGNKIPRKEYLEQLCKYTEGKLEIAEDWGDSFRVSYEFDGRDFVFEDRFIKGFKHALYRGFLKTKIKSIFFLAFTYHVKNITVHSDIVIMSKLEGQRIDQKDRVMVPPELKNFEVFTNEIKTANELLMDKKFVGILKEFISINAQGTPFISLKIIDSEIILDFHEYAASKPSLEGLKTSIPSIENYTEKILYIAKKVDEFASKEPT